MVGPLVLEASHFSFAVHERWLAQWSGGGAEGSVEAAWHSWFPFARYPFPLDAGQFHLAPSLSLDWTGFLCPAFGWQISMF